MSFPIYSLWIGLGLAIIAHLYERAIKKGGNLIKGHQREKEMVKGLLSWLLLIVVLLSWALFIALWSSVTQKESFVPPSYELSIAAIYNPSNEK